ERLDTDDVLRAPGQMDLAGGNHGGDTAVQEAVDPIQLALPWSPVAEDRVDVAVDQAGDEDRPLGIDHGVRSFAVDLLRLADGGDLAIHADDRVGIEDRLSEVAGQEEPDIADHQLAGGPAGGLRLSHLACFLSFQAEISTVSTICAPREAMK